MEHMARHYLNVVNVTLFGTAKAPGSESSKSTSKTALAPWVLNSIWSAGNILKVPGLNGSLSRSPLKNDNIPKALGNIKSDFKGKVSESTLDKYTQYSVFPPYPTKPAPVSKRQLEILRNDGGMSKDLPNYKNYLKNVDPNFDIALARHELMKGIADKTPYSKLSDNARLLYEAVNLALIQEHLIQIQELANAGGGPNLEGLGLNYFEVEVQDTLSRGLAFTDKRLLDGFKVDVPIRQANGKFEVQSYDVNRFNISGRRGENEDSKSFNQTGHPLFLLKPAGESKNAPPLVIARGTLLADDGANGAFESVQADGRKDISLKWIAGNKDLKTAFDDLYEKHGPIQVCGHSLGGNIAAVLAVSFPEHIDRVTTISAAHVSKDVYKAWLAIPPDKRPKVDNIAVEGDLVPSGGRRIVGSLIIASQLDKEGKVVECKNPTERHLMCYNNGIVSYSAGDKDAEVDKTIRKMNTANVNIAGSALKASETGLIGILGLKNVKHILPKQEEAVKELTDNEPKLAREQLPAAFNIPQNLGLNLDKKGVLLHLAIIERANPSQIKERFKTDEQKNELLVLLQAGGGNISPNLARKLYVALESDHLFNKSEFQERLLEILNPNLRSSLLLYDLQKDPGAPLTKLGLIDKVLERLDR